MIRVFRDWGMKMMLFRQFGFRKMRFGQRDVGTDTRERLCGGRHGVGNGRCGLVNRNKFLKKYFRFICILFSFVYSFHSLLKLSLKILTISLYISEFLRQFFEVLWKTGYNFGRYVYLDFLVALMDFIKFLGRFHKNLNNINPKPGYSTS